MGDVEQRAIRIAILAMGGEGGGVLAGWIVDMAETNGFIAQQTSIPGVAQRTGATNYYIELFPQCLLVDGAVGVGPQAATGGINAQRGGLRSDPKKQPVMALSPMPGDVDIVIASELMEGARAIQRGIVTPDLTTLITSTSRVYAMTEKLAPGDGRAEDAALLEASRLAAKRLVACDMAKAAEETGSVISAVMLGALAAAEVLPFDRAQFEATIERGGVGVKASKRGFARGYAAARGEAVVQTAPVSAPAPKVAAAPTRTSVYSAALTEASTAYAEPVRAIVQEGVRRLTDYQDAAYARLFLERLKPIAALDGAHGDGSLRLSMETARYMALGMSFEDTIRVAELKIRSQRFERVAGEVAVEDGQVLRVAEFLHPRPQEIAETVPAWLGRFLQRNFLARRVLAAMTRSGRIVETTSLRGFLLMYAVAGLKPRRRSSLRYKAEQASLEAWLALIAATAPRDYALACEIAECRTLVKGYGDTHERGTAKYERILALVPRLEGHTEPAKHVALLRKVALGDESVEKLDEAIARLG